MVDPALRIAVLGYDGVQALDVAGPLDAFGAANDLRPGAYNVTVASLDGSAFASETGLRMLPDGAFGDLGALDTLLIPGGAGLRRPGVAARVAEAVRARAPGLRRVVSICTGIYGVAPSGLLDGRRATTHWQYAADVAARFPAVRLQPDAIFIKDGLVYSSAGVTAAIDLSLALIEEDFGPALAVAVARALVVYVKRSGGQLQYSEPLQFQAKAGDRFAELAAWMVDHLADDLSVACLAGRVGLSARQFTRRFMAVFGVGPAAHVELLRLDAARGWLTGSDASLARIADAVGFNSDDAFIRAFGRRFGVAPAEYRRRFSSGGGKEFCDDDAG